MKKIYLAPQTTTVNVELSHLVAESYQINDEGINAHAMSKDKGSWDEVWDDEE